MQSIIYARHRAEHNLSFCCLQSYIMQHCNVLGQEAKHLGRAQTSDNFPVALVKNQRLKNQSRRWEIHKEDVGQETRIYRSLNVCQRDSLCQAGLYISNTIDTIRIWHRIVYYTSLTGFARRVWGGIIYFDVDLYNDLLHHICRHLWPSWRSRWSGQYMWECVGDIESCTCPGTSNEMAVSSWLNFIHTKQNKTYLIIITVIVTNSSSDLDSLQFQLTCEIPRIRVKAQYRSTGVLILVKASGAGDYWGEYGKL